MLRFCERTHFCKRQGLSHVPVCLSNGDFPCCLWAKLLMQTSEMTVCLCFKGAGKSQFRPAVTFVSPWESLKINLWGSLFIVSQDIYWVNRWKQPECSADEFFAMRVSDFSLKVVLDYLGRKTETHGNRRASCARHLHCPGLMVGCCYAEIFSKRGLKFCFALDPTYSVARPRSTGKPRVCRLVWNTFSGDYKHDKDER